MKGQSWSMDLVIAVVIFGFIAVIFYSLVLIQEKPSIEELKQRAEFINMKLETNIPGCNQIISGQTTSADLLRCLYGLDYTALNEQLATGVNFCIYVEDTSGRLYIVNSTAGTPDFNRTAFGDPMLIVSGTRCGVPIS